MKPTPFNPETDWPPIPFGDRHCQLAASLKEAGLNWTPQIGCFVWDRDGHIPVKSPFPGKIYFVLNLGHFLKLLGTEKDLQEKLIWLPTWHQARIIAGKLGISDQEISSSLPSNKPAAAGEDLIAIYSLILEALKAGRRL